MSTSIAETIRNRRITSFFALAYALSWTLDAVPILLGVDPSWTRWFIEGFLGPLSPGVDAATLRSRTGVR